MAVQSVTIASLATIQSILEVLPEPSSIEVDVSWHFNAPFNTKVGELLQQFTGLDAKCEGACRFKLNKPSKETLLDLCTHKVPPRETPVWLHEASFFPRDEGVVNVTLSLHELKIDYWHETDIVLQILKCAQRFDDIKITINRIPI